MTEIPFQNLWYQWGHNGTHNHTGIVGQGHNHGPTTAPVTYTGKAHHHCDEYCNPPVIIRLVAFMCQLSIYETISQIKYRNGIKTEGLIGDGR